MARGSKRNMPAVGTIRRYWADELVHLRKYSSVAQCLESDTCFACGCNVTLFRCHIKAKWEGGADTVENIHLLCDYCHKASEWFDGDLYWQWFKSRNFFDRMLQCLADIGVNLSQLVTINYDFDRWIESTSIIIHTLQKHGDERQQKEGQEIEATFNELLAKKSQAIIHTKPPNKEPEPLDLNRIRALNKLTKKHDIQL